MRDGGRRLVHGAGLATRNSVVAASPERPRSYKPAAVALEAPPLYEELAVIPERFDRDPREPKEEVSPVPFVTRSEGGVVEFRIRLAGCRARVSGLVLAVLCRRGPERVGEGEGLEPSCRSPGLCLRGRLSAPPVEMVT